MDKIVHYWVDSSDDDFATMRAMFESNRYSWSLFVGHLMIEKLLKALYVRINNEYPPFIHNLLRLAERCNLVLSEDDKLFFATVTAFNINARYDDYKLSFKKTCTPEFSAIWIEKLTKKTAMDKGVNRAVRKFIDSVAKQQPGLLSAYIFGSYARNNQRSESDIDVALVIDDLPDEDKFDAQVRLLLLASKIDYRIEPHPISKRDLDSDNPFAVEIRKTGIEMKVR